jgi:hypothetical protein
LAGLIVLTLVPAAGAQPEMQPPPPLPPDFAFGSDLFRAVFNEKKAVERYGPVEPLRESELYTRGYYRDVILVITGTTERALYHQSDEFRNQRLDRFAQTVLADGGAVLIAVNELGEVRLPGGQWVNPVETGFRADHRVVPLSPNVVGGADPADPVWAVFDGLRNVLTPTSWAFNLAGPVGYARYPLALQPRPPQPGGPSRLFATGGSGQENRPHRLLVLAEPMVFSNARMIDSGSDNEQLARRVMHFLRDPEGVNRTHCAYFENGRYIPRLDTAKEFVRPRPKMPPLRMPSPEQLQKMVVDLGNKTIDKVQEQDTLNRAVLGPPDDPATRNRRLRGLLEALFVLGAVWAAVWGLRRVWRARHNPDGPAPPAAGGKPRPGPAGIADRRQRELFRRNNVYEPARDMIRELFEAAGAPHDAGPKPPRVEFGDDARARPGRLRKAIDDLWRVGYGRPASVTVQRWLELGPQLELLREAFELGAWRFAATERTEA